VRDEFGNVAISGDNLLVNAWADDQHGTFSASIYLFQRDGSVWYEVTKINANHDLNEKFTREIAISGNSVAVTGKNVIGDIATESYSYFFELSDIKK